MKIGFFGDTHGQAYHLLGAVLAWQEQTGVVLDRVIQVGDFGAIRLETMIQRRDLFLRFAANEPAEFDFLRVMEAQGELAERLREIRKQLAGPIYFLRGNHDERAWLNMLSEGVQGTTVPVDPFDLFHHVPDGTVFSCDGMKLAIFGGVERPGQIDEEGAEHAQEAFQALLEMGKWDVLVSHDPPYGVGTGFHGQPFGSEQVTRLIETIQPRYHIAGHLHTMLGPKQYGATSYFGLGGLGHKLKPRVRDRSRTVQPGTIGLLDTETGRFEFVTGEWLVALSERCEALAEPLAACLY